ncbi:MAG TPA: sugar phosphate nucleotidyltransferase, partial [Acidobacteriota bacterium]|nr:sugar phosphate nucleotidyltransferase [Acidobacteriota bacterium]
IPKPMVQIGYRPILWNVMRYYAHFGHKEFILCLGHRGDLIKKYFVNYDECVSNDFVLTRGGKDLDLLSSDIDEWKITFVDTGMNANIGQRLCAVRKYLEGDDVFLANYADGLTDLDFSAYLDRFLAKDKVASFLAVKPTQSFHVVTIKNHSQVASISPLGESGIWINSGYFIFRKEIFKYIREGEELVKEPFRRLIAAKKIMTHKHEGFWMAMDTFKDKLFFDEMVAKDDVPWEVWRAKA